MIEAVQAIGSNQASQGLQHIQLQDVQLPSVDQGVADAFQAMMHEEQIRIAQVDQTGTAASWISEASTTAADNPWVVQPGPAEAAIAPNPAQDIGDALQGFRDSWNDLMVTSQGNMPTDVGQIAQFALEVQHSAIMMQMISGGVSSFNQEVSGLMHAQ